MKIKITSNGTPHGTSVTNSETGETLKGIVALNFSHRAGELPRATFEVIGPEVEITELGEETAQFVPAKLQSTEKR